VYGAECWGTGTEQSCTETGVCEHD
jgi:hypothetical protein